MSQTLTKKEHGPETTVTEMVNPDGSMTVKIETKNPDGTVTVVVEEEDEFGEKTVRTEIHRPKSREAVGDKKAEVVQKAQEPIEVGTAEPPGMEKSRR